MERKIEYVNVGKIKLPELDEEYHFQVESITSRKDSLTINFRLLRKPSVASPSPLAKAPS